MDYNILTLQDVKELVLMNLDQCKRVAIIDSSKLSTNSGKYANANAFAYYVLINTWGHQICTHASEEAWVYIKMRIEKLGLVPVIRDTSDLADQIIHGDAPDWDYTYGYLSMLARTDYSVPSQDLQLMLQILRFPKRFSPKYADIIQRDSTEAFLVLNTGLKSLNRCESPWYWSRRIKHVINNMLKGFEYALDDGYFSSGTSATTDKLLLSKLKAYSTTEPCIAHNVRFGLSSASGYYPRWRDTNRLRDHVVIQAVPKSYKSARIIAKEPVASSFALQAIACGLRRAIVRNGYSTVIDDQDQETSCELCRLGSIDGSYATIDLTSASDSICENFALSVLPCTVVEALMPYRCAYLRSGDTTRIMQMFATSGSPITFIIETIIFSAISIVATEATELWTGDSLRPSRVYGDDIIIDDRACDLCVQILEAVGCVPNLGKTFSGSTPLGYYRESCGVEYLNGMAMHTRFFPRKPVMVNAEGIAAVCDLQHKLYDNWKIRMFLTQVAKALEPRMTAHPYSIPCSDLWDVQSSHHSVVNKYDTIYGERFKYLTLKGKAKPNNLTKGDVDLLDMWYYYLYLLEGPLFVDNLDRTLGVTTSRRRVMADSSALTSLWTLSIE